VKHRTENVKLEHSLFVVCLCNTDGQLM